MGPDGDRSILGAGERILLVDAKERRYLITLRPAASFHTHVGIVEHDDLIGIPEGSTVLGSTGRRFLVVRPTLSDAVLKMPRGAQVIYPKDLGAILIEADIAPGMKVLEAGVGSGALSMALLRAGAEVIGYELREDFAERARSNVAAMGAGSDRYRVEIRDVYEGIAEEGLDRILLDLPEPWQVLPHAGEGPEAGGHPVRLPALHQPDLTAAGGPRRRRVRAGLHPRGAAPDLAYRAPLGAPRPPHGGSYRLPDHGPPASTLRWTDRADRGD